MTHMPSALLLCSIAALLSACGGKSYSLGSPEAGQSAGGAADGHGTNGTSGGALSATGGALSTTGGGGPDTSSSAGNPDTTSGVGGGPTYHRAAAAVCPSKRGPGSVADSASLDYYKKTCTGDHSYCCWSDSQCITGSNGRCNDGGKTGSSCSYDACLSDSDCPSGTPCLCRSSPTDNSPNSCVSGGNCVVDADCGSAGYCSPSPSPDRCGPGAYYCHTPLDTCVNDTDCPPIAGQDPPGSGFSCELPSIAPTCSYDAQAKHWACRQFGN
jgi:hypothetical protein